MTQSWFGGPTLEEADAYARFERFIVEGPRNREDLHRLAMTDGVDPDDLASLVSYVVGRWEVAGEAQPPAWYGNNEIDASLSARGALLYDGVIHEIAHQLMEQSGTGWKLFTSTRKLDSRHLQPVIEGLTPLPQNLARAAMSDVRAGRRPDRTLNLIRNAVEGFRIDPHDDEAPLQAGVSVHCSPGTKRATITVPEEAEELLGGMDGYERLWSSFENLPWISELYYEGDGHASAVVAIDPQDAAAELSATYQSLIV